jgi:hypothetical protein|nr:MAG: hypothetical protein TU36_02580 [Vulcanisaeta sp. AZ3]
MGDIGFFERGIGFLRWSFMIASVDALLIAALLISSLLITPLATYIFTVILFYFLVISTVIPYALIIILSLISFRDLARYSNKYLIGFIGAIILTISYFANAFYVGYLIINELVGNLLVPRPLIIQPIILARNSFFIVFSLYLPLPVFISLVLGMVGSFLGMMAIYRVGRDFRSSRTRLGSLMGIVGILLIELSPIGITLIGIASALLYAGLSDVLNNVEIGVAKNF